MTSRRLQKIIRARWWVLALAAFLSVAAAVLVNESRNSAIPSHEAVASISYNRLVGEVDDAAARDRLDAAEAIATSVNGSQLAVGVDPLSPGARAEIVGRGTDLRLDFIGRGASPEQATAIATEMRDRYLAVQELDSSAELEQRVADVVAERNKVIAAMRAITPPPDATDIEKAARLQELDAEVAAYAALYGDLTAELLNPRVPPRPQETILEARDTTSERLRTAQDELAALQYEVSGAAVDSGELAVLQAQEAQLRAALDALIAQQIIDEPIGVSKEVTVEEAAIPPTPLPVAAILGLTLGLLIGLAGLVIVDRIRQPLWAVTELEPRYRLPEIAARPRSYGQQAAEPWYGTAPQGQRKVGIQQLRSHVEGIPGFGRGIVVGLASLAGTSPNVHELAADLAASLTYSGSWTLLIDADYANPSDLVEFRAAGLELHDVITDPQRQLGEAIGRLDRSRDLLGVSIPKRDPDAADTLALPAFATVLDIAQDMHDVVIVACPPTDSASYHVLSQRLDAMILVAVAGDLAPSDVVNALHTLGDRRAAPVGVVLVQPRVGPISLIMRGLEDSASLSRQEPYVEPEWGWSTSQAPRSSPSDATVTPLSEVSRDRQGIDQPASDTEIAKPGTKTARITRRATAAKETSTPPQEQPSVASSPWSFRQERDDVSGDSGSGQKSS